MIKLFRTEDKVVNGRMVWEIEYLAVKTKFLFFNKEEYHRITVVFKKSDGMTSPEIIINRDTGESFLMESIFSRLAVPNHMARAYSLALRELKFS